MSNGVYFTGDLGRMHRVPAWKVRRAIERAVAKGQMAEPLRVGISRVFLDEDLAAVQAALRAAGYISAPQEPLRAG